MQIGVLGTGTVGVTLATALIERGHTVCLGSRSAVHETAVRWASDGGDHATNGTFADAVHDAELVVNATAGIASLEALNSVGAELLGDKIVLDVANPLDFSRGFPPVLSICNDSSLGEQIQRHFPNCRVVKALNMVTADVMTQPGELGMTTDLFVAGDDASAKTEVIELLTGFGWQIERIRDLGDISAARGMEMYLALWLRVMQSTGTPGFNIAVIERR